MIYKDRFVCRKLKKAMKNHPCKKTKRGRYLIDVLDSYYDEGGVGIGYYNGMEIIARNSGYEHPKGNFYHHLIYDDNPIWSFDERVYDKIMNQLEKNPEYSSNDDLNLDLGLDFLPNVVKNS